MQDKEQTRIIVRWDVHGNGTVVDAYSKTPIGRSFKNLMQSYTLDSWEPSSAAIPLNESRKEPNSLHWLAASMNLAMTVTNEGCEFTEPDSGAKITAPHDALCAPDMAKRTVAHNVRFAMIAMLRAIDRDVNIPWPADYVEPSDLDEYDQTQIQSSVKVDTLRGEGSQIPARLLIQWDRNGIPVVIDAYPPRKPISTRAEYWAHDNSEVEVSLRARVEALKEAQEIAAVAVAKAHTDSTQRHCNFVYDELAKLLTQAEEKLASSCWIL